MPTDLALSSTLIGSNYPCLELIFMVPKVFEPLKFDCMKILACTVPEKTVPRMYLKKTENQLNNGKNKNNEPDFKFYYTLTGCPYII